MRALIERPLLAQFSYRLARTQAFLTSRIEYRSFCRLCKKIDWWAESGDSNPAHPRFLFVFIIGTSGSGTTMLSRMLSEPPGTASLGGNYVALPSNDGHSRELVRAFQSANRIAWDRNADFETQSQARRYMYLALQQLVTLPGYNRLTHIVFKRSAPFFKGDRFRPDLADLVGLFPKTKILAIYRDPRASAVSSLRRKFAWNLRQCAVMADEQLTYLSSQLSALPSSTFRVLNYEHLCTVPERCIMSVADFLEMVPADLARSARQVNVVTTRIHAWRKELDPRDVNFLDHFFDDRRHRQWALLSKKAEESATII